jgi:hypothetical protein
VQHHVEGKVANMDDYRRIRPMLYPDHWFPRTLMGIEGGIYGFYDRPELIHRINSDHCDFNLRVLDQMYPVCVPTFMTIAEDMSYNGP